MRLITHAAAQRNLTQWGVRREHEALRDLDAPTSDPGASGHAKGALEQATEVADADADKCSQIPDANLAGKVGVDMYPKLSHLPGSKATTPNRRCSRAVASHSSKPRTWAPIEECYGMSDMCFGGFAVAIPRTTRCLHELDGRY
jgi:hypothetical protein